MQAWNCDEHARQHTDKLRKRKTERQNDWIKKYDEKPQQMEAEKSATSSSILVVVVMAVMMMMIKSCIWNAVYVFNGKNEDYNIMWINNGSNSPLFGMIMPNGMRSKRKGKEVKEKNKKGKFSWYGAHTFCADPLVSSKFSARHTQCHYWQDQCHKIFHIFFSWFHPQCKKEQKLKIEKSP